MSNDSDHEIKQSVKNYYTKKVQTHGAVPRGVDWNSAESQELRFQELLRVVQAPQERFSVTDYGCGYGAMAQHMSTRFPNFEYRGFDLSDEMVKKAQSLCLDHKHCTFFSGEESLKPTDYTVASGIFSVKLETELRDWERYIQVTLNKIAKISTRGFSFNMLTSHSDADRMRPDLYYANPGHYLDYCIKNFSRHVALLHNYGLYEFSVLVRF